MEIPPWAHGVDEPEGRVHASAADPGKLHLVEEAPPARAEEPVDGRVHAVVGEDRVDLALEPRADAHEGDPGAGEAPPIADRRGRDPALGQELCAEEVCERVRVDAVVLHPPCGDRLGREGMGHMRLDAGLGEEVSEPAPAIRRLEGDAQRPRLQLAEDAEELLGTVRDATAEHQVSDLIESHDVRAFAMQVDSEVHHLWASFLSFVLGARYAVNTGAEARSFMASAASRGDS